MRAKGGVVTQEPGTRGGTTVFAFVLDPDGYPIELINLAPSSESLRQLSLRMVNIDRAINFYQKVLVSNLYYYYYCYFDVFAENKVY